MQRLSHEWYMPANTNAELRAISGRAPRSKLGRWFSWIQSATQNLPDYTAGPGPHRLRRPQGRHDVQDAPGRAREAPEEQRRLFISVGVQTDVVWLAVGGESPLRGDEGMACWDYFTDQTENVRTPRRRHRRSEGATTGGVSGSNGNTDSAALETLSGGARVR